MSYFVTGATGFIGRHLVERLLERDGDINLLVREESLPRLAAMVRRWGGEGRIRPVVGDLRAPRLGVSDEDLDALRGQVDHFFHLAAIYDMTADEERNRILNVEGTRSAVDLAEALEVGHFHHVSSIAVAGDFPGEFTEDMFDAGQHLPSPYHRTKFESERLVRELARVPWRVYRPAVVVGHSQTGEMDKIDGPYYFFSAIKRAGRFAPEWLPLVGPDLGTTNIVPVDYVAAAIDHLAHVDGLDGQAFHLTDPNDVRADEVINVFARAAGAPQFALRIDKRFTDAIPRSLLTITLGLPVIKQVAGAVLRELDIPAEVLGHIALEPHFDTTKTRAALAGSGLHVPALDSYADKLWDYWADNLDPGLVDRSLVDALHGRTVVITGASSGIGRTLALKVAAAGGIPILVSRGKDKLDDLKQEIEGTGGMAYVEPCDLSDMDAIGDLVERLNKEHTRIDFLVNNAGRSIRRSVKLSYDRFHDYERTMSLNYFGAIRLILGLLPKMSENKGGHIVNVSSIGVQTNPPRFSAYVASKAALDAFSRVVASETFGDNITFTTIHMPLVRTPMIAPTKLYDSFPTITPDEAADLVCDALRRKPKHIGTKLGTFGEVAYALVPKRVDQVLHLAYRVFPDSTAARGEQSQPTEPERIPAEARALARMLPGVHW